MHTCLLPERHHDDGQTYQRLEQVHGDLEEIDRFGARFVVGVAGRVERGDARPVGVPLVLPELLVRLVVAVPVRLHVVQELRGAVLLDQRGEVVVLTARVAILVVGAVAVVGPQPVDTPRIRRTWGSVL